MFSSFERNGVAIVTLHCAVTIFLLVSIIAFIYFQFQRYHSWERVFQNKFVKLTLCLTTSMVIAQVSLILLLVFSTFSLYSPDVLSWNDSSTSALQVLNISCLVAALLAHIALLYVRTQAVIVNSKVVCIAPLFKFLLVSSGIWAFLVVLTRLLILVGSIAYNATIAFTIVSVFFGLSSCTADVVSSYCFIAYVRESSANLSNQKYVQDNSTQIIAKIGSWISVISLLTSLIYISSRITTSTIPRQWQLLVMMTFSCVSQFLWMYMKIILDRQHLEEQNTPGLSTRDRNESVRQRKSTIPLHEKKSPSGDQPRVTHLKQPSMGQPREEEDI
jgi:hypothetical protein